VHFVATADKFKFMNAEKLYWGKQDNKDVYLVKMSNAAMEVSISNFGAIITSIIIPDKNGEKANVVLGYDALEPYLSDPFYLGCVVGRFAGRISNSAFSIYGIAYPLTNNIPLSKHHLHGGIKGFNKQVFDILNLTVDDAKVSLELYYKSPHMEEGYPGNLGLWITCELTNKNELLINYKALTDAVTYINVTNHSYFNLASSPGRALKQELYINAAGFLITDSAFIPTGETKKVLGTYYDFSKRRRIDKFWDEMPAKGYNEYFICRVYYCIQAITWKVIMTEIAAYAWKHNFTPIRQTEKNFQVHFFHLVKRTTRKPGFYFRGRNPD
jgi:aldose 1-epimerase